MNSPPRRTAYSETSDEELNKLLAGMMTDPLGRDSELSNSIFSDNTNHSVNSVGFPGSFGHNNAPGYPSIVASNYGVNNVLANRSYDDPVAQDARMRAFNSRQNGSDAAFAAANKRELVAEAARRAMNNRPTGVNQNYIPANLQASQYPNLYSRGSVQPDIGVLGNRTNPYPNSLR